MKVVVLQHRGISELVGEGALQNANIRRVPSMHGEMEHRRHLC